MTHTRMRLSIPSPVLKAGLVFALAMTCVHPATAAPEALAPLLSPAETDAARLIPPPPPPGSERERAEVAELHAIQTTRSPDDLAHALESGKHEDAAIFAAVLGPSFDLSKLPATAHLMAQVRADDNAAVKRAKAYFKRPRPWIVDASIVGCPYADNKPLSSYPSGHSTMIFAAATVLADLVPEKGQALLSFAQGYAHDRLVCGHHFQSDVVAGEVYGGIIASDLLHRTDLQAEIARARSELRAAHAAALH
jgi:hypothetical protein